MLYPYSGREQYLSGTLAYIEHARDSGGAVVIAAEAARREQLAPHLSDPGSVVFIDTGALSRSPRRLIPAWREWMAQFAQKQPVYGINELVWSGRTTAHIGELRYQEWLFNRAFADAASWSLMCPFDTAGQQAPEVAAVSRCHPLLWDGAKTVASAGYIVGDYPFDVLAEPTGEVRRVVYDLAALPSLRDGVGRFAAACGLPAGRVRDLKLVVAELAANSIRHGGGHGVALMWSTGDSVVCEFTDKGVITEPLVGLIRPAPTQPGGRGLWFVNNICDLVEIRSSHDMGTRVRVSMDVPNP
jgi:anti-sigma regulatory factor (Ser/Thr protein kinase)